MTDTEAINAVALAMEPIPRRLSAFVDELAGGRHCSLAMLVGCCGFVQYSANVDRKVAAIALSELLERWRLEVPDVMPGEVSPAPTTAFEFMLDKLEEAALSGSPTNEEYSLRQENLLQYVGEILAKIRR